MIDTLAIGELEHASVPLLGRPIVDYFGGADFAQSFELGIAGGVAMTRAPILPFNLDWAPSAEGRRFTIGVPSQHQSDGRIVIASDDDKLRNREPL